MRYFLINDGPNVVGKNCYDGDTSKADIQAVKSAGSLTATEVDQLTFDSTPLTIIPSKDQTDWQTEKAKGAPQALAFIAKKLGLE